MITSMVTAAMAAYAEHEAFKNTLATMPPEHRQAAMESRDRLHKKALEASRHRELVNAQRQNNNGVFGFLWGFIIGGTH